MAYTNPHIKEDGPPVARPLPRETTRTHQVFLYIVYEELSYRQNLATHKTAKDKPNAERPEKAAFSLPFLADVDA